MNGPWHYSEAERLLAEAAKRRGIFPDALATSLVTEAMAHATLAAAAASTAVAFFDEDEPGAWAQAFTNDGNERACRVCGCTQERACEGGCSWVADPEGGSLCSACADRMAEKS